MSSAANKKAVAVAPKLLVYIIIAIMIIGLFLYFLFKRFPAMIGTPT